MAATKDTGDMGPQEPHWHTCSADVHSSFNKRGPSSCCHSSGRSVRLQICTTIFGSPNNYICGREGSLGRSECSLWIDRCHFPNLHRDCCKLPFLALKLYYKYAKLPFEVDINRILSAYGIQICNDDSRVPGVLDIR